MITSSLFHRWICRGEACLAPTMAGERRSPVAGPSRKGAFATRRMEQLGRTSRLARLTVQMAQVWGGHLETA